MEIVLDCPTCRGRLSFAARRRRGVGKLLGACDTCGSVYGLAGGRIEPIDPAIVAVPRLKRTRSDP